MISALLDGRAILVYGLGQFLVESTYNSQILIWVYWVHNSFTAIAV